MDDWMMTLKEILGGQIDGTDCRSDETVGADFGGAGP